MSSAPGAPLVAVLGPTNTGKTHRAVERMLSYESGMVGVPLRLLAREIYDRLSVRVGEQAVALVTGEERRVPPRPRYWVCTVEAMPTHLDVDFVAVDEVQLLSHPERGHVFTDRLLHARGRLETWCLGADTVRPLLSLLAPAAEVRSFPRLSRLSWAETPSLGALPPRSVVVAFSAERVYELAERIRARRGGAAVVLGALSPRARNAQVALYQSGEVDALVATDAIGMGLNLDVDHVALADLRKFDGHGARDLTLAEIAQIAGRAGRHQRDGTFGTLAPLAPLPPSAIVALQEHRFPPERRAYWRSSELDPSSVDALLASLRAPPKLAALRLPERASDLGALAALAERPEVRARARSPDAVRLLWAACSIPDFRQRLPEVHVALVAAIFDQLSGPRARLEADWLNHEVSRLDDTAGDLDVLIDRMAAIRTFTYVAHRERWLADPRHWQERTRAVEDRLSDALHDRLVARFVAKRAARRTRPGRTTTVRAPQPAPVRVDPSSPFAALAPLRAALAPAREAPTPADATVEALVDAPHEHFRLDGSGTISIEDVRLGRLTRGHEIWSPGAAVSVERPWPPGARARLERRLRAFALDAAADLLGRLRVDEDALSPAARGVAFQLAGGLGTVSARAARAQLDALGEADVAALERRGVRCGAHVVWLPRGLGARRIQAREALATVWFGQRITPPEGRTSFVPPRGAQLDQLLALGYVALAPVDRGAEPGRVARADVAERALSRIATAGDERSTTGALASWLGCSRREAAALAAAVRRGSIRAVSDPAGNSLGSS
ncbi:MAG: helicase [Polyangiaceae bacterium]|nr:helicase [Polyangiaceae bacterium]